MRFLGRFLAITLAILFSAPASAQTVTNHAFAIGKGPGISGYTSLLCGAGQLAMGQAGADPVCQAIGSLTLKGVPAGTDLAMIQDQAASGALKSATIASLFSAVSSGVNANVLNAQAGNYTIATSDCGNTISASGAGTTITLPAVAGFASNCAVVVRNANATRAQILSGFPSDLQIPNVQCGGAGKTCLFPGQTVQVAIVNGAWATAVAPGRWRKASPKFYANPAGSDNNDCLATGTANACLTIQHAVDLSCFAADSGNTNQEVQLDDGTYTTGFQLVTHCLGNNTLVVTGNHGAPANVVIQSAVAGPLIYAKDKGFLAIDGMKLQPTAGGVQPLSCGQFANIDVNGPIIITQTPSGNIFTATDACTINLNVALTIQDTGLPSAANTLYNVANNARIQLNGVMTFTGTWNFAVASCFAQAGGVIDLNNGSITGGTQTGTRWLSQLNGVIYGGAATKCPGTAATGSTPTGGQAL